MKETGRAIYLPGGIGILIRDVPGSIQPNSDCLRADTGGAQTGRHPRVVAEPCTRGIIHDRFEANCRHPIQGALSSEPFDFDTYYQYRFDCRTLDEC